MQDIADKQDNVGGATGQLPASEYNDHKNEIQDAVEASGQTLNASIDNQFSQALFINGAGAQSCIDGGGTNSIQLSPVTGASGLVVPDSYNSLNGALFSFNKAVANDSATVTVNLGQTGTELGAKNLKKLDGNDPDIGEVLGECTIRYDGTNFKIISIDLEERVTQNEIAVSSILGSKTAISATGNYTTKPLEPVDILTASGLAGDITITVIDGGSDVRNRIQIDNQDSQYSVILIDDNVAAKTWKILPGKKEDFYVETTLEHGTGQGLIYDNLTNTDNVDTSTVPEFVEDAIYLVAYDTTSVLGNIHNSYGYISTGAVSFGSASGNITIRFEYTSSTTTLACQNGSPYWAKRIWRTY